MTGLDEIRFLDVSETCLTDTDLTCRFSIPKQPAPPTDRIGLFCVGWLSVDDCLCSRPIPVLEGVEGRSGNEETDHLYTVTFSAKDLPGDDDEFYQFCYISGGEDTHCVTDPTTSDSNIAPSTESTKGDKIRGASSPFQFIDDDFEILDQPDSLIGMTPAVPETVAMVTSPDSEMSVNVIQQSGKPATGDAGTGDGLSTGHLNETSTEIVQEEKQETSSDADLRRELSEIKEAYALSLISLKDARASEESLRCALAECESAREEDRKNTTEEIGQLKQSNSDKLLELSKLSEQLETVQAELRSTVTRLNDAESRKSSTSELEASLFALELAKTKMAERITRQDREREELVKQVKSAREEINQLQKALAKHEKNKSKTDTVLSGSPKTLFENPYSDYIPEKGKVDNLFDVFDQFS